MPSRRAGELEEGVAAGGILSDVKNLVPESV